ncbi:MAG: orotidine 5'-phosphate decarboxylase / HUMPS family protein [Candidatus Dependentiae bacterium]
MKLQISFDLTDLDKAIDIATQVVDQCDTIEIGTILLYTYGLDAVKRFRTTFAKKTLLVDTKLIDCAEPIIEPIADAGADWITVMAGSDKNAIHSMCKEAHKHNLKVMLDLSDASSRAQSAMEAKNLGADALIFHHIYDDDAALIFLDKWQMIKGNASLPIYISAHINQSSFNQMVGLNPNGLIIGRSIVNAEDPKEEAQYYYNILLKD